MANNIYAELPEIYAEIASNNYLGSVDLTISPVSAVISSGASISVSLPESMMVASGVPGPVAGIDGTIAKISAELFTGAAIEGSSRPFTMSGSISVELTANLAGNVPKLSFSGVAGAPGILGVLDTAIPKMRSSMNGVAHPVGDLSSRMKAIDAILSGLHGGVGPITCSLPRLTASLHASVNKYDDITIGSDIAALTGVLISNSGCGSTELQHIRGAVR